MGSTTSITITGQRFGGTPSINAQGIQFQVVSATATQIIANATVPPTANGETVSLTVTIDGQTSNAQNIKKRRPSRLVRYNFPPNAPNGVGPLNVPENANVVDLGGNVIVEHACGVYRNYAGDLADQDGDPLNVAYSLTETFTDYQGPVSTPPPTTFQISATGFANDTMWFGKIYPMCLGANENETFNQHLSVTIGGNSYVLTTVIHIERGRFNGTPRVTSTITTP